MDADVARPGPLVVEEQPQSPNGEGAFKPPKSPPKIHIPTSSPSSCSDPMDDTIFSPGVDTPGHHISSLVSFDPTSHL